MSTLSQDWQKTSGVMQERIASLLKDRFGLIEPSFTKYMAFRKELIEILCLAKGLADSQGVRKPLTAAMHMLYGGVPEQDTPEAIRKRRERMARGSTPRRRRDGTKESSMARDASATSRGALEILLGVDAKRFELICLEILRLELGAACFAKHTGGPYDRGVDGLVLAYGARGWIIPVKPWRRNVGMQAKRWKQIIRPAQVHAFRGALDLRQVEYGVLFAVSGATPAAYEHARLLSIEVVNGWKMLDLLRKHGIDIAAPSGNASV